MTQSSIPSFQDLALDASRTLLGHAQKTQDLMFATAGAQLDLHARTLEQLAGATPDTLANQGAGMVREHAEIAGRFFRQCGELQVAVLQDLGQAGRQAAEQATRATKAKPRG